MWGEIIEKPVKAKVLGVHAALSKARGCLASGWLGLTSVARKEDSHPLGRRRFSFCPWEDSVT